MAAITLEQVNKFYPNGFQAIHDLNLSIEDQEFLVLVGPSGCGKSTALRMVAGLEDVSDGLISIGGQVVNEVEPRDRDIAMVFQNYALYPHMSVRDNIGFALKLARVNKADAAARIEETAKVLELTDQLDLKPGQLSGGQRQRVAMGRAIVREPAVFLMDEPLSNLDAKLRVQMRAEIASLQRELGVTTIYVTHDQVEAMTMGDRVAVLKDGYLQQVDTPQNLYDRPANVFVAGFIGSPSMNLYEATLAADQLAIGSESVTISPSVFAARPALSSYDDRKVIVGLRPEDIEDADFANHNGPSHRMRASVALVEALGAETIVHFDMDAVPVDAGDPDAVDDLGDAATAVGRLDPRSRARTGESVEIDIRVENLHFFDPETREAIRT